MAGASRRPLLDTAHPSSFPDKITKYALLAKRLRRGLPVPGLAKIVGSTPAGRLLLAESVAGRLMGMWSACSPPSVRSQLWTLDTDADAFDHLLMYILTHSKVIEHVLDAFIAPLSSGHLQVDTSLLERLHGLYAAGLGIVVRRPSPLGLPARLLLGLGDMRVP
ncbi:hypothetical protein CspHIS471_0211720 [Cutaneotrichosporon sp. HIS471]|nr:hypothetical protein CspHIS471_0211720 [Cutaneotrichosporon sp. HIS471]